MSEVFADPALKGQPATHVLVIGVGEYRYMRKPGEATVDAPADKFYAEVGDLTRLSSPQVSATAVANWFLDNRAQLARPLGSVRLLLSSGPFVRTDGSQSVVDAATFLNATDEANAWRLALDENADSIGVFYFCGHGFFDGDTAENLLLFEDFGQKNRDFYEHSCNSDKFYRAMKSCAAKTQVYWFDACRNTIDSWMKYQRDRASKLVNAKVSAISENSMPIVRSTSPNSQAFGDEGKLSRFAANLLDCLRMYGAEEVGNQWMVTTDSIGVSLRDVSNPRRLGTGESYVEPDGNNTAKMPLLRVPDPRVFAKVYGAQPGLIPVTKIVCTDAEGKTQELTSEAEPVTFPLRMGKCQMSLKGKAAIGTVKEFLAKPPVLVAELE